MYKKTVSTEREASRFDTGRTAKTERLEKIEGALDKLKSQDAYFQSLLEGE